MEHVCLADFVAWCNYKAENYDQTHFKTSSIYSTEDYFPENIINDNLGGDVPHLQQISAKDEFVKNCQ